MHALPDVAELDHAGFRLFECQRQPGRLRISRYGCAHRYLRAQKTDTKTPKDEFGMAFQEGLRVCRTCSGGRMCLTVLKEDSALWNQISMPLSKIRQA